MCTVTWGDTNFFASVAYPQSTVMHTVGTHTKSDVHENSNHKRDIPHLS